MPIYEFKCEKCGHKEGIWLRIAERDGEVDCYKCRFPLTRQVSAPHIIGDYQPYQCPITGKEVSGRKAHEENLKRHDCRVLETGETEANTRKRAAAETALDKSVDATVDKFIATLPSDKRQQLVNEVAAGASVSIDRK